MKGRMWKKLWIPFIMFLILIEIKNGVQALEGVSDRSGCTEIGATSSLFTEAVRMSQNFNNEPNVLD